MPALAKVRKYQVYLKVSEFGDPAVGEQFRADNKGGVVGAEVERRARHFVDGAQTLQRDGLSEVLPHLTGCLRGKAHLVESGVSMGPGLSVLTRMPRGASSAARVRPKDRTAAFVAE